MMWEDKEAGKGRKKKDETLPEDLCSQPGESLFQKNKEIKQGTKTKSSALVCSCPTASWLLAGLCCLFCPRRQPGAPAESFVLARRGYLTNPFDDTELPHRADQCDGETHAPLLLHLLLLFIHLPLLFFLLLPGGILSASSGGAVTPGPGYPASGGAVDDTRRSHPSWRVAPSAPRLL